MAYEPREGVDYIVDLYAVSGAPADATSQDLRHAINERSMGYHTDLLQGAAPEFQAKGRRMMVLLNRAREILLDVDKRAAYNEILAAWEGPISTDGTPIMTPEQAMAGALRGKSSEEVEEIIQQKVDQIKSMTGYNPSRISFLESLITQSGIQVNPALRAEYEAALLERDRNLAIEEAERASLLGIDLESETSYVAALDHGETIATRLNAAQEAREQELQVRAIGAVSTKLTLLAGETLTSTDVVESLQPELELPPYFANQKAKVQVIADERAEISQRRLDNYEPIYPEAELQTELRENVVVGIAYESGTRWLSTVINVAEESSEFNPLDSDLVPLLAANDFKGVIERGHGVIIVEPMAYIDLTDQLGMAMGKYVERFQKPENRVD